MHESRKRRHAKAIEIRNKFESATDVFLGTKTVKALANRLVRGDRAEIAVFTGCSANLKRL